jgi:uncharacterized protein YqhQ
LDKSKTNSIQVGGQAVIEGIMMRAQKRVSTAVRKANGDIVAKTEEYFTLADQNKIFKLPVLRGAVGLIEMMLLGIKTLNYSAEIALLDIEDLKSKSSEPKTSNKKNLKSNIKLGLTIIIALAIGILIFFIVPLVITTEVFNLEQKALTFNLTAGVIRVGVLLTYMCSIALFKDVQRIFQYHGAEHKAVFAYEAKAPMTVESVRTFSRFHPRCGTSFLLIVMLTSIILFGIIDTILIQLTGTITLTLRLATHLPLIPLVGGIAYELIKLSSMYSNSIIGRVGIAPGLWLQRITTKEPDDRQIEVAIFAMQSALGFNDIIDSQSSGKGNNV